MSEKLKPEFLGCFRTHKTRQITKKRGGYPNLNQQKPKGNKLQINTIRETGKGTTTKLQIMQFSKLPLNPPPNPPLIQTPRLAPMRENQKQIIT